jgi:hypothetical protein
VTLQVPSFGGGSELEDQSTTERILLLHGCWVLGKTGGWKCIEHIDENSLMIGDTAPSRISDYIKEVLEVQTALALKALVH